MMMIMMMIMMMMCECECVSVCVKIESDVEWVCTFPLIRFTNQDDLSNGLKRPQLEWLIEGLGEEFEELVATPSYFMDFMR